MRRRSILPLLRPMGCRVARLVEADLPCVAAGRRGIGIGSGYTTTGTGYVSSIRPAKFEEIHMNQARLSETGRTASSENRGTATSDNVSVGASNNARGSTGCVSVANSLILKSHAIACEFAKALDPCTFEVWGGTGMLLPLPGPALEALPAWRICTSIHSSASTVTP